MDSRLRGNDVVFLAGARDSGLLRCARNDGELEEIVVKGDADQAPADMPPSNIAIKSNKNGL